MAYLTRNYVLPSTGVTVAASQTNSVVSSNIKVTGPGSRSIRIDAKASAVTEGGGITLKLQEQKGEDWADVTDATAAISANGWVTIRLMDTVSGDQDVLPLAPVVRLVVTTGGSGATVTFAKILVYQEV